MASSAESPPPPLRPALHVQMPSYSDPSPESDGITKSKLDPDHLAPDAVPLSPSDSREAANRLHDDLELLRAERVVSTEDRRERNSIRPRSNTRSHHERVEDAFNTTTAPTPAAVAAAPLKTTWLTKLWLWIKKFPRIFRYVLYAIPPGIIILIPVFLDLFAYDRKGDPVGGPGGVQLLWFGIWLEVIWLTLWATRIITSVLPPIVAFVADTVGSTNHKKWRDIGRQLEFPTAIFLWLLAVLVSYHPILDHRVPDPDQDSRIPYVTWIDVVYKIIIALFVLATLNLVEKVLIKWIATSFHLRTYSHRIRENHTHIEYLVTLYEYAKTRLEAQDPVWESPSSRRGSGQYSSPLKDIRNNARQVWSKVGSAANRVAGDLTGRKFLKGNHPRKVVLELLRNSESSYTLARVFYRTFVQPGKSTITVEDLFPAFTTQEDAEACFGVFDKDLNGDISMEELEMVCNEIHLEKKAIAASLKDLDSVIKKLDEVFMFIIVVIVIIVFISIISNSAAAALTSTGTFILGLSWLLQATAQEFLQSIIFVFVKHPFDVGDRVTIYGNTGSTMMGDDYYVLEVSLLYTEFKKMEGHVVQAPNSVLNTLFILNQRRSQGLADPINLKLRFGTTEAQIEELKARMLEFCLQNKRDYAPRIISEVQTIDEVSSITMNIIFFHKSNYQNELLRLNRHNKFAVELMHQMRDMGLETPRLIQPGGMRDMPLYWTQVQPPPSYQSTTTAAHDVSSPPAQQQQVSSPAAALRRRGNSRAAVVEAGVDFQDVFHNRRRDNSIVRLPSIRQMSREEEEAERDEERSRLRTSIEENNEKRQSMDSGSTTQRRVWRPRTRSTNRGSMSNVV
ncbi:Mechanosensitive ion channel-domain-containing protein [Corynascus novoguineensis]|uniref:Mechanosensitive ion channel protein n=1 Tax=Corynascus novoguineensis TaxID=1126955 RepID=A0AAN7HU57_9PEZI|nr:Mechanosensitive ion channel-domain-containing protein [Corynascus novoguineensis]